MDFGKSAPILVGALAIVACAPAGKRDASHTAAPIDSLVLERTVCFGLCPAYRLRISSDEEIRFESRNRGDLANIVVDTAPRGTYASIISRAHNIGFYSLPPDIQRDTLFCHNYSTDSPTVITSIFTGSTMQRVSDYHGCVETVHREVLPPIQKLRAFEDEIDSTLRSSRWVKPNKPAK